MNKLLILIIFVTNLFSLEIKNGDVLILKAPKEITGELYLDKKRIFWIADPNDKNQNIAILAANYRQKNNMVAKSFVNGKTEEDNLNPYVLWSKGVLKCTSPPMYIKLPPAVVIQPFKSSGLLTFGK